MYGSGTTRCSSARRNDAWIRRGIASFCVVVFDQQFDATIEIMSRSGRPEVERAPFSDACNLNPSCVHSSVDQCTTNGLGTPQTERIVVSARSFVIAVPHNYDAPRPLPSQLLTQARDGALHRRPQS